MGDSSQSWKPGARGTAYTAPQVGELLFKTAQLARQCLSADFTASIRLGKTGARVSGQFPRLSEAFSWFIP